MTLRSLKLKSHYPFFLANKTEMGSEFFEVTDKFSQKPIAQFGRLPRQPLRYVWGSGYC